MLRFAVFLLLMSTLISPLLADPRADSFLSTGARAKNIQMIEFASTQGADVNTIDEIGCTPLIRASVKRHSPLEKILLERGAVVEALDAAGLMALMWEALDGREGVMELLLAGGANPEMLDNNGVKAAGWARRDGHEALRETMFALSAK